MTRRGWSLFVVLGVVWGVPYLLIRVAVDELDPLLVAWARCAVGVALLLPSAVRSGAVRAVLRHWRPVALFAGVEVAGPWLLLGHAETRLTSSTAGLLVAVTPMLAAVLAVRLGVERLDPRRAAGLALGFAGVAAVVGLDLAVTDLAAVGAVGLTALGYAVGPFVLTRHLADAPPLGVVTLALVVATLVYTPFVPLAVPTSAPSGSAVAATVGLGVLCTAVAFVVFLALVAEAGPSRATVITFVNPAVAVVLGAVVLAEPVGPGLLLGFPLIVVGAVLATAGPTVEPVALADPIASEAS